MPLFSFFSFLKTSNISISIKIEIKANTKQTYTIVFELDKVDNQEMYDAYKDFSANIYIDLKTTGSLGE